MVGDWMEKKKKLNVPILISVIATYKGRLQGLITMSTFSNVANGANAPKLKGSNPA